MKKRNYILSILFIVLSNINVYAASCEEVLGSNLIVKLKDNFFTPLRVIAPILLLVFTTADLVKIVFSDETKDFSKAGKNFLKRGIATLIVFFAGNIVAFILGFVGDAGVCLGL